MIQFTTPTVTLTLPDTATEDLTQATKLVMTFQSGGRKVEKELPDLIVTAHSVGAELTQSETALLKVGECGVMANWVIVPLRISSSVCSSRST